MAYLSDLAALKALRQSIMSAGSKHISCGVLSLPLQHLDPRKIPPRRRCTVDDRCATRLAIASLHVFNSHGKHLMRNQRLVRRLVDAWPDIWRWMVFLYTRTILASACGAEIASEAIDVLPAALICFSFDTDMRRTIADTPGVITMVTKCWLKEDEPSSPFFNPSLAFTVTLGAILAHEGANYSTEVPKAVDGGALAVARIAVGRLRDSLSRAEPHELLDHHLCLVLIFIDSPDSSLRIAILCDKIIPAVIKALALFSSLSYNPYLVTYDGTTSICLSILQTSLESANGPSWAIQAFDSGLLPSLMKCGPILGLGCDHKSIASLFSVLCASLVFRSVLRSVTKTLKEVQRLGIGEKDAGVLWSGWLRFKRLAKERLTMKKVFDDNEVGSATGLDRTCGRVDCPNNERDSGAVTVMRCSGCLKATYCSPACQKVHWGTHRSTCHEMKHLLQEGRQAALSQRDHAFIIFCSERDIFQLPPKVNTVIDKWSPQEKLVGVLDYTKHPFEVTICPTAEFFKNAPESIVQASPEGLVTIALVTLLARSLPPQ